jgi:uncharacterized membrane protein HdeD (DUF308 family)
MEKQGIKNWWFLSVNGIVSILLALMFFFVTQALLEKILLWFGIGMVIAGAILLVSGILKIRKEHVSPLVWFSSLLCFAVGLIVLFLHQTIELVMLVFGIWAVLIGITQIALLVNAGKNLSGKNLFLVNALITIGFGVALFFHPYTLPDLVRYLIGIAALIAGILMVYFSFLLKGKVSSDNTAA